MAYLVFRFKGMELGRWRLRDPVVLGRSSECDISVRDIMLSRRHCRIERRGRAGSSPTWRARTAPFSKTGRPAGVSLNRSCMRDRGCESGKPSLRSMNANYRRSNRDGLRLINRDLRIHRHLWTRQWRVSNSPALPNCVTSTVPFLLQSPHPRIQPVTVMTMYAVLCMSWFQVHGIRYTRTRHVA